MKGQRRGEAGRTNGSGGQGRGGGRSCDPSDGTAASTSNSLDVFFSLSIFWRSEGGYEKNGTAL